MPLKSRKFGIDPRDCLGLISRQTFCVKHTLFRDNSKERKCPDFQRMWLFLFQWSTFWLISLSTTACSFSSFSIPGYYISLCPPSPLSFPHPSPPPPGLWFVRTTATSIDGPRVLWGWERLQGSHCRRKQQFKTFIFILYSPNSFPWLSDVEECCCLKTRLKHLEYNPWDQNSCFIT